MEKTFIGVRDVNEEVFRKFRAKAIEEKMRIGDALNKAMERYLDNEEKIENKPNPKNLLKISAIIKTKGRVRWSEEIDETLYG